MKLPPRRTLRSILNDAILDRQALEDPSIAAETRALVSRYKALMPQLADDAPPLSEEGKDLLALACMHARIWRESYHDSWKCTGDRTVLLACRQDVDRVTRTETALGVIAQPLIPEGARSVTIHELRKMLASA